MARGNPGLQMGGVYVDQLVSDFMVEHKVDGMALAIVQAPYISRACGYGVSDPARQFLVGTQTVFPLGQLADAYTAVAVMQLVEGGQLALEDVRPILLEARDFPALEARIAEASGVGYREFVRARQIEPLGLRQTFFAGDRPPVDDAHKQFLHEHLYINPTEAAGSSDGLYASASDVSFWDIALAGDILIKSAELRALLYKPGPDWTSGPWVYPGRPGLMVVTGTGPGFSTLLSRFTDPSDLVCVTLLCNREGLDLTQLARQIAGAYDVRLGPPVETAGMRVQQSPYDVPTTVERLEKALAAAGIGLLGKVDHAAGAARAQLALAPTVALSFGNPAAGTHLMYSNPAVAVDLPLRALVYSSESGVWIAATDPVAIAHRHGITDREELVHKMRAGVDRVLLASVTSR